MRRGKSQKKGVYLNSAKRQPAMHSLLLHLRSWLLPPGPYFEQSSPVPRLKASYRKRARRLRKESPWMQLLCRRKSTSTRLRHPMLRQEPPRVPAANLARMAPPCPEQEQMPLPLLSPELQQLHPPRKTSSRRALGPRPAFAHSPLQPQPRSCARQLDRTLS